MAEFENVFHKSPTVTKVTEVAAGGGANQARAYGRNNEITLINSYITYLCFKGMVFHESGFYSFCLASIWHVPRNLKRERSWSAR